MARALCCCMCQAWRHPHVSTSSLRRWVSLAPGHCITPKVLCLLWGECTMLLQTPVQEDFTCSSVPVLSPLSPFSPFHYSNFSSIIGMQPSVPSLASQISVLIPAPVTRCSLFLHMKCFRFAKSHGVGNTVKTRHCLGCMQGRNNAGANTKKRFSQRHTSKGMTSESKWSGSSNSSAPLRV